MPREKLSGIYQAKGQDGRTVSVYEYTDVHTVKMFGGTTSTEEGLKSLGLEDGSHCNRISDTEFQIVGTGESLTVIP